MSSSTSNLDLLISSQAGKDVTANALFDAGSPATLFGRRGYTSSGLTWGYYGGYLLVDGVLTLINNGTLTLTASTTNYVEANRSGTVSKNTTGFTAGSTPLYTVVTGTSTVTSYTDYRLTATVQTGRLVRSITSDANITLTAAEARNNILEFTSSVSLTATRNVVVPLLAQQWTVFNNTTGAQALQFIGASGTGVTVASGMRAIIYSNGTNVVRVTADT